MRRDGQILESHCWNPLHERYWLLEETSTQSTKMITIQKDGPLYDSAHSTDSTSWIVQPRREYQEYVVDQRSRPKPNYNSKLYSWWQKRLQENLGNKLLILHRVLLDAYSRRHEAQKIYLRQAAVQRWLGWRDSVLQGQRPHSGHTLQLGACDDQLRVVSLKPRPPSGPSFHLKVKIDLIFVCTGACGHHRWFYLLRYAIVGLPNGEMDSGRPETSGYSEMGPRKTLRRLERDDFHGILWE